MSARPSRTNQTPAMPPASARQNEYFVPRDGIDREVITSDICRYLGNDALVRPGTYESPDGHVTQGYYITAYRNLTTAMIQDLKADSARWEQERRAASRSSGGGAGGSREQRGQSDYSAWKNRQREQAYEASYSASAMDIDYPPAPSAAGNPVYPGQAYPGGPPGSYAPAAYPPQAHAASAQYPAQPSFAYPPNVPPAQYSAHPQTSGDRYSAMAPPIPVSYSPDNAAFVHGSNYQTSGGYATAGPTRILPPTMPPASAATSRTYSAPAGGAPVFGAEADPYSYPQAAGNATAQAYPTDALYGRGATGRQGYGAAPEPPYDDLHQAAVLQPATTSPNTAPAQSSGVPATRRDRDRDSEPRDRERDHRDHRARRPEQDREERHAERNRHRHR